MADYILYIGYSASPFLHVSFFFVYHNLNGKNVGKDTRYGRWCN